MQHFEIVGFFNAVYNTVGYFIRDKSLSFFRVSKEEFSLVLQVMLVLFALSLIHY